MDRSSSSRQLQRLERISNSPYKRPTQQQGGQAKPKSPIASFPSLRSIYSFVTAPFSRQPLLPQTNRDLQIEEDQKSQSGSEDGWNGSPPPGMEIEDVSSLAAAGRRITYDEESQEEAPSDTYKPTGLTTSTTLGSRPSEPRYSVPLQQQSSSLAASTSRQTPSTVAPGIYGTKRPIASFATPTMSRKPLPSFLPQAATGQSAASIALTAFVEAKKGQTMTPQDMRVMRTLMEDIEAEQPNSSSSQNRWTAGIDSPRQVKSIRETQAAGPSTPNRLVDSIRRSPGPLFSVGSPARSEAGPNGDSPASRRIRYLGPGMSPKRMLNKSQNSDKPLFTTDIAEESEPKRQKTEATPTTPESNATSQEPSPSKPPVPSFTSRALDRTKNLSTPAKPSPLSRVNSPTPASPREQQSIDSGKRRAANIVKELMEKEIGPIETLSKRDYMVINPYDLPSAATSRSDLNSSLTRSASRSATPKKSILRSSLKGSTSTPLSGAAAKLEAYKPGRKLTTLELLDGKRPWTDNVDQSMHSQTPTPERDDEEVDELMEESPAPSRQRSPPPAPVEKAAPADTARPLPKMPAPFQAPAFKAPKISSPARPVPSFSPSPVKPRQSSASTSMAPPPVPTAKFTPSAHVPTPPMAEIENSTLASISRSSTRSSKTLSPAQKVVLNKPVDSLAQFALKISVPKTAICAAAEKAALAKSLETFSFDLTAQTTLRKTPSSTLPHIPAFNKDEPWICSLCSLSNPASNKEKCFVCEAPRSAHRPSTQPFSMPNNSTAFGSQIFNSMTGPATGEWTCDTCMLKNPDSAKEKCTVCEARRPALRPVGASFTLGSAPPKPSASSAGGPWTCSLCMLQNPDSAKEKCQVCEAKRP